MVRILALLFILLSVFRFTITAQNGVPDDIQDLPLRIEIPARSVNETYRIIPAGKAGLLLYYRSTEVAEYSKINWYFALYDTNLIQVWLKSVPLPENHTTIFQDRYSDTLAILFAAVGKTKNDDRTFEILRIFPNAGQLLLNAGSFDGLDQIADFGVRFDRAWIGLNQPGKPGKVLTMNLTDGFTRTFSLGAGNMLTLLHLQPGSNPGKATAVVSRQLTKKSAEYFLVSYDTTGKLLSEVSIGLPAGDRVLNRVTAVPVSEGNASVLGCYGQDISSGSSKTEVSAAVTGFFCCPVRAGRQQSSNFYNFLEFKNVNSFIGEKDILNLKKKALKKNRSLGDYSLDFQVVMHEVITINDQYIMAAEVFSPQYHSENFTDFDFYGRPYTNSYSVFDGYRFSNTIVAGFNQDGKLLWDNNIEMRNFVTMELSPNVIVYPSGNNLVLFYYNEGMIGSRIIHENEVVEKTDQTPVDLMFAEDKLVSETKGNVQKWYGNYFITSGYQEIKNIARETGNKRLIFHIAKLQFFP